MVLELRACYFFLPQSTIVFTLFSLFCFVILMDQAALLGNCLGIPLWSKLGMETSAKKKKFKRLPGPYLTLMERKPCQINVQSLLEIFR